MSKIKMRYQAPGDASKPYKWQYIKHRQKQAAAIQKIKDQIDRMQRDFDLLYKTRRHKAAFAVFWQMQGYKHALQILEQANDIYRNDAAPLYKKHR